MSEINYNEYLSIKIGLCRKEIGMTQEQLAERLGISYQAISKWENGIACPDIMTLPLLADVFGISIDELFRDKKEDETCQDKGSQNDCAGEIYIHELPWDNNSDLHAVLYKGHKLLKHSDIRAKEFVFKHEGKALNVQSYFSVRCDNVNGNVSAGDKVNCSNVGGSVEAGDSVTCNDIWGNVNAGNSIKCRDIYGAACAEDSIYANNIRGKCAY